MGRDVIDAAFPRMPIPYSLQKTLRSVGRIPHRLNADSIPSDDASSAIHRFPSDPPNVQPIDPVM